MTQPVEVTPIGAEGITKSCPCCKTESIKFLPDRVELPHGGYLSDGDTIPIARDLPPEAREGFGWDVDLAAGKCPSCRKQPIEICVKLTDAEPDDEIKNVFFWHNGERGAEHHFALRTGSDSWTAERLDTSIGPMAEHTFGPFADNFGDWIGPSGVASCRGNGPWDFAALYELWGILGDGGCQAAR